MANKIYVTRRRARFSSVFEGPVNLPWGTQVECRNVDGEPYLFMGDKLLCAAGSQITKEFFVQNDAGPGVQRGQLLNAILACLDPQEAQQGASNARWEKIWADRRCRTYKRPKQDERWIWSDDFYNAPISDLRYIASIVGAKT